MKGQTFDWTGGRHRFFLNLGQLRAIQTACNAGPMELFVRLAGHQWRVDDVIEPIVLGLVGSGEMSEKEARKFVDRVIFEKEAVNLLAFVPLAAEILQTSCMLEIKGGDEDDEGKSEAGETTPATST